MKDKLRLEWFESTFPGAEYSAKVKRVLGVQVITSFTDRENKGVQPVPDDFPVVVTTREGIVSKGKASIYNFKIDSFMSTWKPDYEALLKMQAEYDFNNFKDTMNHKQKVFKRTPIYTQEMKDNGELPKVGMLCKVVNDGYELSDIAEQFINQEVEIKALFKGKFADLAAVEMDSGTCQCFRIEMLAPLKTPEQIELEEAKKKQLEDMCFKYKNLPLEVAMQMQKNGDFPEIVPDDLNARGMAKQ